MKDKVRKSAKPLAIGFALLAGLHVRAYATLLQSSNFSITAEAYSAAGATVASSANFRTFANAGDTIGFPASANYGTGAGPAYTFFFAPAGGAASPLPGQPGAPAGTAVGVSSISWTWNAASNAAGYNVFQASSSSTALGSVATPPFFLTGLATNTAYGIVVQATNPAGNGPLSGAATAYTMAAAPAGLALTTASSVAVTVSWSTNTNPAGTVYDLQQSTGGAFVPVIRSTLPVAVSTGLAPSTAYTFLVRALNGDSIPTAFSASVATTTMPPPPGIPGTPAGSVLGVSSISWTWSAASNAASYLVYPAANPSVSIGSSTTASYAQTALAPNATYSVLVAGVDAAGAGPPSAAAAAVYTLAYPPSGTAASNIQAASATISWSLNGNPAATLASLEKSTDNAVFTGVLASSVTAYTDFALQGCSTYYYRVRNFNGGGLATSYDSVQFTTLGSTPLAPGGLSATSQPGNVIALSWNFSPSSDVVAYRLYWDAGGGAVAYNAPLAALASTATAYSTGVLLSSAAYKFALRAFNRCAIEEANTDVLASAASLSSLTGVKAAIKVPDSGKRISGNRVTIVAELVLGNAAQTSQVLFQYKASTASSWINIVPADANHPNPAQAPPYVMHWDVTSLSAATYDLRAVATDILGNADAAPPGVTIAVDPVNFDIDETSLGGGKEQKRQAVNNGAPATVEAADEGSAAVTKVVIPAGALNNSTLTVTVVNNPAGAPAAPNGVSAVGVVAQITLSNGQSLLAGGQTASLTLTYPDANNDGIVDGTTTRADRLRIYSYDPLSGSWKKDFGSTVDLVNHTVTGSTPHFSFFSVFAPSAADLSAVRVYPVPFKPNGGNPNEGAPFSSGDPNSGIIFDNLPQAASVKIYTVAGELVARFSSDNTSGKLQWDARNDAGRDAASGGYLAVISSPGQPSVTKKLLIIR